MQSKVDMETAANRREERSNKGRHWLAVCEVGLIFLLFFLHAGSPPPGDDEAHYLGKAKHYWNSAWCPGDFFLDSADAHLAFNWTVGWLTAFLPLSAVAIISRAVVWLLLAWAWRRLSWALFPRPLVAVFIVAMYLVLRQYGHMAREWIVGGIEAKCIAYVFVLLGLEALVQGKWNRIWLHFGAASAFHVLVGGWSVVAAGIAWLWTKNRPPISSMLPAMGGGLLLALFGFVPGVLLTFDAPREIVSTANEIYVFQRLSHHLVFHLFPWWYIARFAALTMLWAGLCWLNRRNMVSAALQKFVVGTLLIAALGLVIDVATLTRPDIAAALLRYYWFRLADVMIPLGTAVALTEFIARVETVRKQAADVLWGSCILGLMVVVSLRTYWRWQDFRPGADVQGQIVAVGDWRDLGNWIEQNLPPDVRFLTPPQATTFRWYAGRSEVASWKDIPQDAVSIVEWSERVKLSRDFWRQLRASGYSPTAAATLAKLAREYDVQYLVVDRQRFSAAIPLPQVYPTPWDFNATYAVYQMPVVEEVRKSE